MPTPERGFGRGCRAFWVWGRKHLHFPFRWGWDLRVNGPDPPTGPKVVAANHFSHLDVLLISKAIGPLRYLTLDHLFRGAVAGPVVEWWGGIATPRNGVALGAMRTALASLAAGHGVGVFPEGRRVWTWGEAAPKRGAAWLAQRAGVPLVPVAISGTEQSWGRGARRPVPWPVRIEIGPALDPAVYPGREGSHALLADWHAWMDGAMARLRNGG